jgi:hypothetical protein
MRGKNPTQQVLVKPMQVLVLQRAQNLQLLLKCKQ